MDEQTKLIIQARKFYGFTFDQWYKLPQSDRKAIVERFVRMRSKPVPESTVTLEDLYQP